MYNDGTNDDLAGVSIQPPVAVIINNPRRLSVSEPYGGYTDLSPDGATAYTLTTGYSPAWDIPFDSPHASPMTLMSSAIEKDGRTDNVKIVYLQRLANPLMPYNNTSTDPDYNPYRTIDRMPDRLDSRSTALHRRPRTRHRRQPTA